MVTTARNSGKKNLVKGKNRSPKEEDVKIYWFPSLAHKVWTNGENFDDFNDFDDCNKMGGIKRILGPFYKNVGDFPKNVGLFLRNLRRFFFYLLVFFVLELRWNNPLVWRLWKQKVQNPCNVRAWYAHARRLVGKGSRFSSVVSYDCYERLILCFFLKIGDSKWA